MTGMWSYPHKEPFPFGDTITYPKGMDFLSGIGCIEDWGCGTAWASRYLKKGRYAGIDGSPSKFTTKVADLRKYTSSPDGIFMRHVLEHNLGWADILGNAVQSFRKRMALIMFIPFGHETRVMNPGADIPEIQFKKDDLTKFFKDLKWSEESFSTPTQFSWEHIFYLEKIRGC